MKFVFRMFLLCCVAWMICINSWAYADIYAPKVNFPINTQSNVLTCAADHEKQLCWFAILFHNPFPIPLIFPEEQTQVYRYDEKTNTLSWEFTSYHKISTIVPFNTGVIFLREHYFFLDDEICYYDTGSKRVTVFSKPRTVGNLLAVHDDTVYYQGALAYNDTDVYAYNINMQEIRTICKDVNTAYADRQHLYIISNTHPVRLDIYNIDTGDLTDSAGLNIDGDIVDAADSKALVTDGTLYFLDHPDAPISDNSLEEKRIEIGWIDGDRLVIISEGILESYLIGTERIEQVFSYRLDDNIISVNMLQNKIVMLRWNEDWREVELIILDVDGENEVSVLLSSAK